MNIDIYSKTSFGAKFISSANVKKFASKLDKYVPEKTSFVEIDPTNSADVSAVGNIAKYWEHEKYASNINYTVESLSKNGGNDRTKVFAISSQNKDLDNLDDKKILGVAEIEKFETGLNLRYLQVNPDYIFNQPKLYKHVGSEMLNCLKNYYGEPIMLNSLRSFAVRNFYENNGFKLVDEGTLRYQWLP